MENSSKSCWGWGCLLAVIRSSSKQSCVPGRARSQLCTYPSCLVYNLPWGAGEGCEHPPASGCRAPSSREGDGAARQVPQLICTWSFLIKINSRVCLGQEQRVGAGLRQQGRLVAPGKLCFAVAADGGGGGKEKEKVLQGELSLPNERNPHRLGSSGGVEAKQLQ